MLMIRRLRLLLGIKQKELADQASMSLRELVRIESREVQPKLITVQRIDQAFDIIMNRREEAASAATESEA